MLTLDNIGDLWKALGNETRAISFWERAADILDELQHRDSGPIHTKLDQHRRRA